MDLQPVPVPLMHKEHFSGIDYARLQTVTTLHQRFSQSTEWLKQKLQKEFPTDPPAPSPLPASEGAGHYGTLDLPPLISSYLLGDEEIPHDAVHTQPALDGTPELPVSMDADLVALEELQPDDEANSGEDSEYLPEEDAHSDDDTPQRRDASRSVGVSGNGKKQPLRPGIEKKRRAPKKKTTTTQDHPEDGDSGFLLYVLPRNLHFVHDEPPVLVCTPSVARSFDNNGTCNGRCAFVSNVPDQILGDVFESPNRALCALRDVLRPDNTFFGKCVGINCKVTLCVTMGDRNSLLKHLQTPLTPLVRPGVLEFSQHA